MSHLILVSQPQNRGRGRFFEFCYLLEDFMVTFISELFVVFDAFCSWKNPGFPFHWAAVIFFQVRKGPGRVVFFSICQGQLDIHTTMLCVMSREEQTQTPLTCKFKEKKGESSSMWTQGCLLAGLSQWIITFSSPYLSACFLSNFSWSEQESCRVWPLLCLQSLMSRREWAGFVMHCDVFPQIWAQCVTTMLYFQALRKKSVTFLFIFLFLSLSISISIIINSAPKKLNSNTFFLRENMQVFHLFSLLCPFSQWICCVWGSISPKVTEGSGLILQEIWRLQNFCNNLLTYLTINFNVIRR